MAGISNFVLRWEVNNAAARIARGNGVSKAFKEGGFEWKVGFKRNKDYKKVLDFSLACGHPEKYEWMCETDFEFIFGPSEFKRQNIFTYNKRVYGVYCIAEESLTTRTGYINMDKIVVEFRVKILSSKLPPIIDLTKFSSPNELSNAILVIGDKKLLVSKDYLSIHSPFFAAMFFGDFAEKEKEEVELKELVYEEFIDLLQLLYFRNMEITDRIVSHILKLGDRFQIQCAVDLSEKYLKSSSNLTVAKKLMLADQYRLTSLKDHCLQSFTSVADLIGKLKSSPDCTDYSDAMAAAIFREIMKLNLQ